MPTYEYLCGSCGNQWEEMQKITEPALDTCPKCGKKTAQRQISGGNFILKGGGWYADLYSSAKPAANKDSTKSEGTAPATTGKTETKSEAPAPKKESPSAAPPASSGGSSSKE